MINYTDKEWWTYTHLKINMLRFRLKLNMSATKKQETIEILQSAEKQRKLFIYLFKIPVFKEHIYKICCCYQLIPIKTPLNKSVFKNSISPQFFIFFYFTIFFEFVLLGITSASDWQSTYNGQWSWKLHSNKQWVWFLAQF